MKDATHALVLVGVLSLLALACMLAGGFFIHAWRERREDREYLLFGVGNLAMASYILTSGLAYLQAALGAETSEVIRFANVALVSSIAAVVFMLHFGVEHARLRNRRQAMWVAYGVGAVFTLAVVTGQWWRVPSVAVRMVHLGPFFLPYLRLNAGWLGTVFFLSAPIAIGAAGWLFGLGQRRVGGPMWVVWASTAVLVVGGVNDSWGLGAGYFATLSVLPFAFSLFGLSVSFTLIARYGRLAGTLEQRTQQLNERSEQLIASLEDLSQTRSALIMTRHLAVVGGLIEELAEELNEPLDRAQHALDALGRDSAGEDELDDLEQETGRINRLVSDLLSFARPIALNREEVEIEPILQHCLGLTEAYPEVDVQVSCELPWPSINADPERLRQVFEHLVHNALAAVRDGGELALVVSRAQHHGRPHVRVEVQDTGEGMTEEALRRALAPFFTTRSDGTGFGLPICKRVVETHGGELQVTSKLGVGTAVIMLLPVEAPAAVPSQLRPPSSMTSYDL